MSGVKSQGYGITTNVSACLHMQLESMSALFECVWKLSLHLKLLQLQQIVINGKFGSRASVNLKEVTRVRLVNSLHR